MNNLAAFRKSKNDFMRDLSSPLAPDDRVGFSGLNYFPENLALALDIELDTKVPHDPITMDTSDGRKRTYVRAGQIHFTVEGAAATLNIYQDDHGFFLPFRDGTSGQESYAAGRYLEPEMVKGKLHVDFNYAYNPYCAYSERYSCPLPPAENWLKVAIRAGERKFKE